MYESNRNVLDPLLYSSLFSFPLTLSEIVRFSPQKGLTESTAYKQLEQLAPYVKTHDNYYFLSDQESSVTKRKKGVLDAEKKFALALRVCSLLRFCPTVMAIALSGSVALGSSNKADDIDLFVVTKRNTVYSTRLVLLVILHLVGLRKKNHNNGMYICLNMIIDEDAVAFGHERQDLYTARELMQMRPLFSRNRTVEKLELANKWCKKYLPNARMQQAIHTTESHSQIAIRLFTWGERLSELILVTKLKRDGYARLVHKTFLALHSKDHRGGIMNRFSVKSQLFQKRLSHGNRRQRRMTTNIDKHKNIFYTA